MKFSVTGPLRPPLEFHSTPIHTWTMYLQPRPPKSTGRGLLQPCCPLNLSESKNSIRRSVTCYTVITWYVSNSAAGRLWLSQLFNVELRNIVKKQYEQIMKLQVYYSMCEKLLKLQRHFRKCFRVIFKKNLRIIRGYIF